MSQQEDNTDTAMVNDPTCDEFLEIADTICTPITVLLHALLYLEICYLGVILFRSIESHLPVEWAWLYIHMPHAYILPFVAIFSNFLFNLDYIYKQRQDTFMGKFVDLLLTGLIHYGIVVYTFTHYLEFIKLLVTLDSMIVLTIFVHYREFIICALLLDEIVCLQSNVDGCDSFDSDSSDSDSSDSDSDNNDPSKTLTDGNDSGSDTSNFRYNSDSDNSDSDNEANDTNTNIIVANPEDERDVNDHLIVARVKSSETGNIDPIMCIHTRMVDGVIERNISYSRNVVIPSESESDSETFSDNDPDDPTYEPSEQTENSEPEDVFDGSEKKESSDDSQRDAKETFEQHHFEVL